jgi:HAE1 family hydrophobic/amphiphilic exporter-1
MEEDGMDGMEASRVGTKEIALAVLATSLSLVVIFVPIAFMGGIVGRFFSSFGLTVAFAVMMSLFVSFTLTPMLCSRFLKLEHGDGGHAKSKSGFFYRIMEGGYVLILKGAMRAKWLVVLLTIGVIFSTVPIASIMGMSLIPRDDQSEYEVTIITPAGYSLDRTDKVLRELEGRLRKLKGTVHLFTTAGEVAAGVSVKGEGDVTRGTVYVRMTDLEDREYSQFAIQQQARELMKDFPDLRASVNDVSAFQGGRRSQTFQVNLSGPDLNILDKYSQELLNKLREGGGIDDLDTTLSLHKPEVQIAIDREAASDLGIPVGTVADTLRILVGGLAVSRFKEGDEQYDVWLRAQQSDRNQAGDLATIQLPSPAVGLTNLVSFADFKFEKGPTEIERYGRERIVTVLGNPSEGVPLGDAVKRAGKIVEEMHMAPGYRIEFTGQAKTMAETGYYFMIAFGLSVLFMYLILAAQFESWTQPISILMALPVTVPFGLLSLVLFRSPMDIYAMFGLFMLVGIVKKNGILQVDATNQLRAKGMSRHDAIMEANKTRLRPILMTTVMLVAAMVPIALGQGPGAAARASMAKLIIGGQALSLVLALIVTPVFYSLLDMWVNFTRRIGIRFTVEPRPKPQPAPTLAESAARTPA